MPVQLLKKDDLENYRTLAAEHGSVFNRIAWSDLYNGGLHLYGVYDNDNRLIAGFHLYHKKQLSLTHITNPPYCPHIGLFYQNKTKNASNALSYNKKIITEIADFINDMKAHIVTIALPFNVIDTQPFFWKKFKVIPNYTYRIELLRSNDELLLNLSSDKRNSLNKAVKDNIQTLIVKDYKIVEELVLKTFTRKNKGFDSEMVNKILYLFANDTNSFSVVSSANNIPVSVAFCIYDKTTCYYLLGGYDDKNKHQAAGVSSLWGAILHAKKLGLPVFDLEGSMLPEVERFFRGFGGDLVPYYTVNKGKLPLEIGLKLIKRELF